MLLGWASTALHPDGAVLYQLQQQSVGAPKQQALRTSDGSLLWERDLGWSNSLAQPVDRDGNVFFAGQDWIITKLNGLTGATIWQVTRSGFAGVYTPAISPDGYTLAFFRQDQRPFPPINAMSAISTASGTLIWDSPSLDEIPQMNTIIDSTAVYTATR